jgi:putative endonuclease
MYYVYVLYSLSYNTQYIGHTDNLERRVREHSKGKSRHTKNRGPWKLIYKEEYPSRKEAAQREKHLKTGSGRAFLTRKLKKMEG